MEKLLLSAFACDPTKGSEPGNGWNWADGLVREGFEVHCLTRIIGKKGIESNVKPEHLHFHYIVLPLGLEGLYYKGNVGMYLYYLLWQWFAYRKGVKLKRTLQFKVVHHVTWGSLQMGSFLYKLNLPFVFGPAGGGQKAPLAFKKYFYNHWEAEEKRDKISSLMVRFNPAFKSMVRRAHCILVSNSDTFALAKDNGASNVVLTLDSALPEDFFPKNFVPKHPENGKLNLLWIGRFMPRKGILLVLDVMKELKQYNGIKLTVVGDGEMKSAFLKKIEEDQLENIVDWVGAVPFDKVKDFYASHDVFFFTSLRDSGPSQLVEALAYGLPIVTINIHGQERIVSDKTGIRCPVDSPEIAIASLKDAILKLYANPGLVKTLSFEAHQFAIKQNWKNKITAIVNENYPS